MQLRYLIWTLPTTPASTHSEDGGSRPIAGRLGHSAGLGAGSSDEAVDNRAMERPGRDVAHSSTVSPYARGVPAPLAVIIVFILALGIGKEFSSDPSPIAHPQGPPRPQGQILISWGQLAAEFEEAARTCEHLGQRIIPLEPINKKLEDQIMEAIGGFYGKSIKMRRPGFMAVELEVSDDHIPAGATELRYHSSNLAALAAAVAYGTEVPPVRLAVGEAATIPSGKKASPGIFYSGDL